MSQPIEFFAELAGAEQKPNKDNTKLFLTLRWLSPDGTITDTYTENLTLASDLNRLSSYKVRANLFTGKYTKVVVTEIEKQ